MGSELLRKAREALSEGDLIQASEKGWGAAAQMVKAVAEQRGWPHDNHRALYQVANRLAAESGDRDIRRLFSVASAIHQNFYEHWMPAEMVEEDLVSVEELVAKLEP